MRLRRRRRDLPREDWKLALGVAPLSGDDPRKLGGYRLLGRLGGGGMGVVYLGERRNKRVAIKVIRPDFADDEHFRVRFGREVSAARRVRGSCTAHVLASDPDAKRPYFVSEYVEGPTLRTAISWRGPLSPPAVQGLAVALAEALAAMHSVGVVHRDLTPSNVILSPHGPKVIDFGIARAADATPVTRTGGVVGTPAWMAPEQALGMVAGEATDVFAWGVMVAYAATARTPFGHGPSEMVVYRVVHEPPDLSGLDPQLLPVVARTLSKTPEDRPSADELLDTFVGTDDPASTETAVQDLLGQTWVLDDETASLAPTLAAPLPRRPRAARPRRAVAAVVAVIALVASAVGAEAWRRAAQNDEPPVVLPRVITPSTTTSTSTTTTTTNPEPPTFHSVFAPFDRNGNIVLTVTSTHAAACLTRSVTTPRQDAWNCKVGGDTYDPCFLNPIAPSMDLACTSSTNWDGKTLVRLTLQEPLPDRGPGPPPDGKSHPWFVELEDSDRCWRLDPSKAGKVGDEPITFSCVSGALLVGEPDEALSTWTLGHLAPGNPNARIEPVAIATAWL